MNIPNRLVEKFHSTAALEQPFRITMAKILSTLVLEVSLVVAGIQASLFAGTSDAAQKAF